MCVCVCFNGFVGFTIPLVGDRGFPLAISQVVLVFVVLGLRLCLSRVCVFALVRLVMNRNDITTVSACVAAMTVRAARDGMCSMKKTKAEYYMSHRNVSVSSVLEE